ncbi:hypothetical protein PRIPAC_90396 [Pristionchus pacificus]|uniref:Mitochondrial carrier protein n=1 Tax=Pristionchus pacificus TaxID=54126 RepID=A0A2A6CZ38_PRIPA|nr:hypothetical protein PRIPAC_90396 [Pristionchus pacificus]|eukprot:PDM83435.1 mitochondrial carrier protein [Pristionchus pacificus]
MTDREAVIHFVGGAVGGTAGTAITCPLEVVKTRMQSARGIAHTTGGGPSTSSGASPNGTGPAGVGTGSKQTGMQSYKHILANTSLRQLAVQSRLSGATPSVTTVALFRSAAAAGGAHSKGGAAAATAASRFVVLKHFTHIVKSEGFPALYKGLVPNLIGVAPAKAVYFYTYSSSKRFWNDSDVFVPNSAFIHMMSAASAGFVSATAVNPVWLVKTRLQLLEGSRMGVLAMVRRVYQREGIRGFYRGVTASYAGISETVIQFVLYEYLRQALLSRNSNGNGDDEERKNIDFVNFMVAGGIAKFVACVAAYPHEVVRTRLREEGSASRGFFSTLFQLYKEGVPSMYRGLSVQLMRTVPNTAITMGTYELVVHALHLL